MKLALILLSICVAISHQQYFHPRMMMMGYPRMSPFAQQPSMYYLNNYMGPYMSQIEDDMYDTDDGQARIKGHSKPQGSLFQSRGENRFLSGSGSTSIGNPLLKTVTFTITSTCTALSVTTCVAISNLSPNPVACAGRRRRFAEYNDEQVEDIETQYPIIPSEVRIVMPTEEPTSSSLTHHSYRPSPFGISSSIEEAENELASVGNKRQRNKRFFQQLWNAFATGVTTTTWSVVSSTFTSTLAIPGANTLLPCLPAGYGICQIVVGK